MDDAEKRAEALLDNEKFIADSRELETTSMRGAIAAAISDAVEAERERCARIADEYDVLPRTAPDYTHQQGRASAAADIAARIREGKATPAPAWTKEPPKQGGIYWYRRDATYPREIRGVYCGRGGSIGTWWWAGIGDEASGRVDECSGEWSGPIAEPPA